MRTNLKMLMVISICTTALVTTSCKKEMPATSTNTNQPGYSMYMTDDPADYQQVNVDIIGAQVNMDETGWIPLKVNAGVYNLLNFSGGFDTLIASGILATGHISQVRLMLGTTGNTVMVNNATYPLQIPADDDARLKVSVSCYIEKDKPSSVMLDFDAGRSVIEVDSTTFILKPVIRLVAEPTEGSITGKIAPDESQVAVLATGPDTAYAYTRLFTDGFRVWGLMPGTYTLLVLPRPPFAITTVTGVAVNAGEVTDVGTIKLQ